MTKPNSPSARRIAARKAAVRRDYSELRSRGVTRQKTAERLRERHGLGLRAVMDYTAELRAAERAETLRRDEEIRRRSAGGATIWRLSKEYNLNPGSVWHILHGKKKNDNGNEENGEDPGAGTGRDTAAAHGD